MVITALFIALGFAACPSPTTPHTHNWGVWTESTAATCIEPAEETRTCTGNSTHTETRISEGSPALGHDFAGGLACIRADVCGYNYAVGGDGPAGGKIFHIVPAGFTVLGNGSPSAVVGIDVGFDEYTAYYLEVALEDALEDYVPSVWGGFGTLIGNGITTFPSTSAAEHIAAGVIGNGRKDTQIIIAALGTSVVYAARSASEYTTDSGHTDWFLPSLTELILLFGEKSDAGMGSFEGNLWSSSQLDENFGWIWAFYSAGMSNGNNKGMASPYVRAVRAF